MQLWKTSAAAIYLASYLPLSVILMAQDISPNMLGRTPCSIAEAISWSCTSPLLHPALSVTLVLVCSFCFGLSIIALNLIPAKIPVSIIESKHIPADLINYVLPYILSFITLSFDDFPKMLGFAIFFVWIFWITFKSGQIAMNPVLPVLGWRLYEIKYSFLNSSDVLTGRMLSRVPIKPSHVYKQAGLQDIMIVKDEHQESSR